MKKVRFGPSRPRPAARSVARSSKSGATRNYKRVKKPQWDDTVSDLAVHKASKDELEQRRRSVQSKNAEAARHDLYDRAKGSVDLDSSGNLRPSPSQGSAKMAALQRALHGKELHEVLAESDRAMAVVKDLFGDDPKRYASQPNVTVAPHVMHDKKSLERTLLEGVRGGPSPTAHGSPGGIRDEGVLALAPHRPALNELTTPPPELDLNGSAADDEDTLTAAASLSPPSYRPAIDLQRFQRLVDHDPAQTTPQTTHPSERKPSKAAPSQKAAMNSRRQQPTSSHTSATDEVDSVTGLSEISSIQPDDRDATINTANATVDSEASMYSTLLQALPWMNTAQQQQQSQPHTTGSGSLNTGQQQPAQASSDGVGGVTVNESTGERARNSDAQLRGTSKTTTPQHASGSIHPLQISHKMPPPPAPVGGKGVSSHGSQPPPSSSYSVTAGQRQGGGRPLSDLDNLEKLVQDLERELSEYERTTGYPPHPPPSSSSSSPHQPGTLGGLTASLLRSVTRLAHYLRHSEVQLRGEVAVRGQLLHTMTEQQNLMDALTTDMVRLKRGNEALTSELKKVKKKSAEDVRKMQDDLAQVHKKLATLSVQHSAHSPAPHKLTPSAPQEQPRKTAYQGNSTAAATVAVPQAKLVVASSSGWGNEGDLRPTGDSQTPLNPSLSVSTAGRSGDVIFAQISPLAHSEYRSIVTPPPSTADLHTASSSSSTQQHLTSYPYTATTPVYTSALLHSTQAPSIGTLRSLLPCDLQTDRQSYALPAAAETVSTSPSNYAPSPPPLSIALQVPDFALPPMQAPPSSLPSTSNPTGTAPQYFIHNTAAMASQSTNETDQLHSKSPLAKPEHSSAHPAASYRGLQRPDLSMSSIPDPSSSFPIPSPYWLAGVSTGSVLGPRPSMDTVMSAWSEGFEVVASGEVKVQDT